MEAVTLTELVDLTGRTRNAVQSQLKRSSIRISGYILGHRSRKVGVYAKLDIQHLLPNHVIIADRHVIPLGERKAACKSKLDNALCQDVIKRGFL